MSVGHGDTVCLVDGRVGTVTFVGADVVRFVALGESWQHWEWVPRGDVMPTAPASHADGIHGPHVCIQPGGIAKLHDGQGWHDLPEWPADPYPDPLSVTTGPQGEDL